MVYSSSAAIAAREDQQIKDSSEKTADASSEVTQFSTHSAHYLERQAFFAVLGIIIMLFAYQIDYERYRKYATPLLVCTFFLLLMVYVPKLGRRINGSARWLNLGVTLLQVSELAKLAMILYMARKISDHQAEIKSFVRGFLPSFMILCIFMAEIVLEPDLGATVILATIVYMMWFVGGMRIIHLLSVFLIGIPAVIVAILAQPFRIARVTTFLQPFKSRHGAGWQAVQSLISVSTGGVFGLGLGEGPQKYQFLSEGHTDFIFAGICEELGMVGALTIVLIYTVLMIQGIRVAIKAPDLYGSLLATGISVMIGVQAFINMYVVTVMVPTKGFTLPLVSYGGSSLMINCLAIGILMNVSRYTEMAAPAARKLASSRP